MMEILVGCLATLVVSILTVIVVGVVYAVKAWSRIRNHEFLFDDVFRQMSYREEEVRRDFNLRMDSELKEMESTIDSRLDKLENRLKVKK
jgi:hypothetical protein